jgi:hypothetical protein
VVPLVCLALFDLPLVDAPWFNLVLLVSYSCWLGPLVSVGSGVHGSKAAREVCVCSVPVFLGATAQILLLRVFLFWHFELDQREPNVMLCSRAANFACRLYSESSLSGSVERAAVGFIFLYVCRSWLPPC